MGKLLGSDEKSQLSAIYRATTLHDTMYCMDAKTGKTVWKKDFPVDEEVVRPSGTWAIGAPS